jgi:Peptidase family C25
MADFLPDPVCANPRRLKPRARRPRPMSSPPSTTGPRSCPTQDTAPRVSGPQRASSAPTTSTCSRPSPLSIAAFSPSGLSLNEAAHVFHTAFVHELQLKTHSRLGDLVLDAQQDYAQTGAFPELLAIYHLFGDPALRIQ